MIVTIQSILLLRLFFPKSLTIFPWSTMHQNSLESIFKALLKISMLFGLFIYSNEIPLKTKLNHYQVPIQVLYPTFNNSWNFSMFESSYLRTDQVQYWIYFNALSQHFIASSNFSKRISTLLCSSMHCVFRFNFRAFIKQSMLYHSFAWLKNVAPC